MKKTDGFRTFLLRVLPEWLRRRLKIHAKIVLMTSCGSYGVQDGQDTSQTARVGGQDSAKRSQDGGPVAAWADLDCS